MFSRVHCVPNIIQPSREYWCLVLDDVTILPAPAVPASTGISARLKCVGEHGSPVNMYSRTSRMRLPAPHLRKLYMFTMQIYSLTDRLVCRASLFPRKIGPYLLSKKWFSSTDEESLLLGGVVHVLYGLQVARPVACMQRLDEVIKPRTILVGFQTIHNAGI